MKITLRKAKALQTEITNVINMNPPVVNVELSEFDNVSAVIEKAKEQLSIATSVRTDLIKALYTIRALVGTANETNGISTKLTEKALIERLMLETSNLLASGTVMTDIKVIEGKIAKLRAATPAQNNYGYRDSITTGIFSEAEVTEMRIAVAELKKQKTKLDDELLELNVRMEVELPEQTRQLLVDNNIL